MSWTDKTYDELPIMFRELVDVHTKPICAERDRYRELLDEVRSELSSYNPDREWCIDQICQALAPDTKDEK